MTAILIVLVTAWIAGFLAHRWFGYPPLLGELIAGIVLGPPLMGWLPVHDGLKPLAEVGVFMMLFYIGMEIDPKAMLKSSKPAILAALGGFVLPFLLGYYVTYFYLLNQAEINLISLAEETAFNREIVIPSLFVGIGMAVTALIVKSRILLDLKLLDTRIAMVLMTGALLSDTAVLIVFSAIMNFSKTQQMDAAFVLLISGNAILFFLLAILIGEKAFPWVDKLLVKCHLIGKSGALMVILIVALGMGLLAHALGLHQIVGAFMAGLFARKMIGDHREFIRVTEQVQALSMGFLAPIFFVTIGYSFSLSIFTTDLALLVVLTVIAIASKIIGVMIGYLPSGYSWREGFTIGCAMNGRGAVEIVIAGMGLEYGLINQHIFSILVFIALFTSVLVPFSLKLCTDWLRRRGELDRITQREGMLIFGAGPLARLVAKQLSPHISIKLIDRNKEMCNAARKNGLQAVHGNVLDDELLDLVGARRIQTVVAMTSNPEINILAAQFAKEHFFVPELYVMMGEESPDEFAAIMDRLDIIPVFSGPVIHGNWDQWIQHKCYKQETITVNTSEEIKQIQTDMLDRTCLPITVSHSNSVSLYHSKTLLAPGITISLIRPESDELIDIDRFDLMVEKCPFLDLDRNTTLEQFFLLAAEKLTDNLNIDKQILAQALEQREEESGTILGPGVAVPHTRLAGEKIFQILIARSKTGVIFKGEVERAHIIFALISSTDERNLHLRSLSAIVQIVQGNNFMEKWRAATDLEELRHLIRTAPRRRF